MPFKFYSNMEDVVYCGNEEVANKIFKLFSDDGYTVGKSGQLIKTGTHGDVDAIRIDIYKN